MLLKKKETGFWMVFPNCHFYSFLPSKHAKGINRIPNFFPFGRAAFDHLAVQLIGSGRWHIRLVISETITTGTEAHMLRLGDPGDMVTW